MLAGRLVSIGSYEFDREISSLDLMKTKFNDDTAGLVESGIMIKDMLESRKIFLKIKNKLISKKIKNLSTLSSVLILSKHFWPDRIVGGDDELVDEDHGVGLEKFGFLPQEILILMKEFETIFNQIKPTQRIEWKKNEGVVTVLINIRGKDIEFKVSPLHLEVLSLFNKLCVSTTTTPVTSSVSPENCASPIPSMTTEEIAKRTKLAVDQTKSIVSFWVAKGILREIEINRFIINE
jgi:hypothetical protein